MLRIGRIQRVRWVALARPSCHLPLVTLRIGSLNTWMCVSFALSFEYDIHMSYRLSFTFDCIDFDTLFNTFAVLCTKQRCCFVWGQCFVIDLQNPNLLTLKTWLELILQVRQQRIFRSNIQTIHFIVTTSQIKNLHRSAMRKFTILLRR